MSFEKATRLKLRFKATNGFISTEDLWDLKLESLDTIAKGLNKELKESTEESFIAVKSKASSLVELKFEIVKRVISVKLEEAADKKLAIERKEQEQKLINLIATKQEQALGDKSIEELQKELAALRG